MVFRVSKLYWPVVVAPKYALVKPGIDTSKSHRLMAELGLIKPCGGGFFHILPIAQKSLDVFCEVLSECLSYINCQKVTLPILTNSGLWRKSGRLKDVAEELFIVNDKHGKEYVLSPTHEESITQLISMSSPISYKKLPIRLYQIGHKFRDEIKPRFGLLRTKEFLMMDLYTFDRDKKEAHTTYKEVAEAVRRILDALEIPWVKVNGSPGTIGGTRSHEYHILSNIGEDTIIFCESCGFKWNADVYEKYCSCPKCLSEHLTSKRGIEIAHTFLLEDKYSLLLNATVLKANGNHEPLSMCCFGIGITRLLAACLEVLSEDDKLMWPRLLAPFDMCIIPPKDGSKEQIYADTWIKKIRFDAMRIFGEKNIIIDDRTNLTIGKRLIDSKKMGYPLVLVIGLKAMDTVPQFELHFTSDGITKYLEFNELMVELSNYNIKKNEVKIKLMLPYV